ncbi:MAG: glutamine synthetase III [Oscillospiraceae bacterium]|nr:glutamine synthetase III [Oscillospiraceae bacterium]
MSITEIFGSNVFNLTVMKERLPKDVYKAIKKTINNGTALDPEIADVVANAMKDWAIEKGATHFTHWFQPMTGITAEKHDSFIAPTDDGKIIMEFSGKELIMGEPDASSFPSGGLRATFEARGYTTWDPTSYAFIKDSTLCIPTAFCSYSGEVLDKKTPLLRSMEAVSKQALRVLRHFGSDATRVISYVGPEQEYFLTDSELYHQRKDLILTGRTLFGAKPAKGQELEDHYFGVIKERVSSYMKELDEELWKLGVLAKTKHNEVAPAQHELAPIFSTANIASDHNQLTMEIMKKVAERHNLVCLLHAKPFEGINGSGKHNNWSIGTNTGENLLKPGDDPISNKKFLIFLCATIRAVHKYGYQLRLSVATAGNDHRLGANEAPPAIVSMFLGEQLDEVIQAIKAGKTSIDKNEENIETGVDSLPVLKKDATDRNRTSPFAFTGNKFEFRMPGSSQSIAGINIVINAIVADVLSEYADRLDKAEDVDAEIWNIIKDTLNEDEAVIFNGNNYSDEWVKEAEERGLPNLRTTADALPLFKSEESIKLYERLGIFTPIETSSRCDIMLEDYAKALHIEALTMIDMASRDILPACISYAASVAESVASQEAIGLSVSKQKAVAKEISELNEVLIDKTDALRKAMEGVGSDDPVKEAEYYKDNVIPAMEALREVADTLETKVDSEYWPMPTYTDLLFYA